MFKVLVTGAKGQVGSEIVKAVPAGFTVIGLVYIYLYITNQQKLNALIAQ